MKESKSPSTRSGLGIEELLSSAFNRTKERFLPYILGYFLAFAIGLGVVISILLLAGINALLWAITKSPIIGMALGAISTVGGIIAVMYVQAWIHLATAYIIIAPKKLGVIDAYKAVKPFIWKFVKVMIITGIFMIGLIPFGLLSLTVIFMLWSVWGMFTAFVFLERKESGLKNLFVSRAIVNTNFWGVVLRVVMVYAAYFFVMYLLGLLQMNAKNSGIGGLLIFVLGIFATPFIMSYLYEIYRNLEQPKEAKSSTVWIVLSVIGWIINIGLIVLFITSVGGAAQKIMNDKSLQKDIMQQFQKEYKQDNKEFNKMVPKQI